MSPAISPPTTSLLLHERAGRVPDAIFLRTRAGDVTYGQASEVVHRVANGLIRRGVIPGSPVALFMRNSADHIVCSFAVAESGGVAVPLNPLLRSASLVYPLVLTAATTVIVDEALLGSLLEVAASLPDVHLVVVCGHLPDSIPVAAALTTLEALAADDSGPPPPAVASNDLDAAMMLFTSGTSGPSKACVLSHRYLLRQGQWHAEHLDLGPLDVLYCPFPLFHIDAATLTVIAALTVGATAAIGERFSTSKFWEEVTSFDATVFNFMGATLTMLWKQPRGKFDRAHRVRLAWGVPMPEWHEAFSERFGIRLYEVYGLTDAGVVAYDPLGEPHRPGACGRVIDEYEVAVADEHGDLLPVGQEGEILIRPRERGTIMDGYYSMPNETLQAFSGLWFHTGDLGKLDAEGYLYFLGRNKDMIRRRGENISAFEVEESIIAHPEVLEVAAFGVPSELSEDEIMACVVKRPGSPLTYDELIGFCEKSSPRHMIPRFVEFVHELPKTPTLKVEKFKLRERGVTANTFDREAVRSLVVREGSRR